MQDFISIFATLSSIVDPDHLWQADVFLFAGSNSSCPLIIWDKPGAVELNHFNGQNTDAWLFQVEHCFEFYSIFPVHQLLWRHSIWMVNTSMCIAGYFATSNFLISRILLRSFVFDFKIGPCVPWKVDSLSLSRHPLWQRFEPGMKLFLMTWYTSLISFWLGVSFLVSDWKFRMKSLLESPHP